MERITVNLAERSYPISIGAGLFEGRRTFLKFSQTKIPIKKSL